jgi:hypothetical protein
MQVTLMRLELQEQPIVNSWDKLIDYCNAQVAHNTGRGIPHPVPRPQECADQA